MELSTDIIKLVLFLTLIIGINILGVTNKILPFNRYNCRCGVIGSNSTNRITGGRVTEPHAYPWQALILRHNISTDRIIRPEDNDICGGSVINFMYILTAAHCVAKGEEEKIDVVLGVHDRNNLRSNKHQFYKVVEITIHENYYHEYSSDIAILKLNARITFNKLVKPICLQNQNERIKGKSAIVLGWGHTEYKGSTSDFLEEAPLKVWGRERCVEHLIPSILEYDETMFCAYGGKQDACGGDSGGPVFYKNHKGIAIQIGIVSMGDGCGVYPGVYNKISIFLDWIHKHTKDVRYCKR